jgi:hypothetical protein
MKSLFTLICLSFAMLMSAQPIETFVNSSGITLKDTDENQRINLDGNAKLIEIRINDSLMLHIQGGHTTSIKLLNTLSQKEIGMELQSDGTFSIGEFDGAPPPELGSTLTISNGLFRPAPNTQAIATGNQERLRITADGDIGIGTLTPLERLDVDGGVRIGFAPLRPLTYPHFDLKIDELGILYKTESTIPDGPQQGALLELIEKQNRAIEALTSRLTILEEKVKID